MEYTENLIDIDNVPYICREVPYICRQNAFCNENQDNFNIFNEVNIDNIVYKSVNIIPIISQSKSLNNNIKNSFNIIKLHKSKSL